MRSDGGRSNIGRDDDAIHSFMFLENAVSCFLLMNDPEWLGQKASQHFAPSKYVLSMMEHASKILIYLFLKGRKSTVALVQINVCMNRIAIERHGPSGHVLVSS